MRTTFKHPDGVAFVEELSSAKRRVEVVTHGRSLFIPIHACETSYPVELIGKILEAKGLAFLCDEIMREESPKRVQESLKYDLLSYVEEEQFRNKRLLDFGCGCGASTLILSRMFPQTDIMGIELEERFLSVARARAAFCGRPHLMFHASPGVNRLPSDLGNFDYIVLSAVYEHLLPTERPLLLRQLWQRLQPDGLLFINQTPYRFSPVETHTTNGLPFINYLPDRVALNYARYWSKRDLREKTWPELLRAGIRGGSVREILNHLSDHTHPPRLLSPSRFGLRDRVDLWYVQSAAARMGWLKWCLFLMLKSAEFLTDIIVVPQLSLAIKKGRGEGALNLRRPESRPVESKNETVSASGV